MLKLGYQVCLRTLVPNVVKSTVGNVIMKENLPALNVQSVRHTSFFNRLSQEELWKGVTSVSNAGKRRGRGRLGDRKGKRNLNEGQKMGEGKIRIQWPGLNSSVVEGGDIAKIKTLPEGEQVKPAMVSTTVRLVGSRKAHPLDRGWTGKQTKGKRIGPPQPVQDETFEGFDSIVLQLKLATKMTAVLGRKRSFFAIVATGNGNGLIGLGAAKTSDSRSSVKLARKKASRRLLTIDLIEKNKVNHDFFSEYGRTKITVLKKPDGYGLKCHRVIAALCKLIGIENLYAKVEGASSNTIHISRAFIVGLLRQKTYQEIADEKKLHLVEFTESTLNFPKVLASPQQCLTPAEARKVPVLFEEYIMGGRLVYKKSTKPAFYTKSPSWSIHLKRTLFYRNHEKVKVELLSKYGSCMSHLTKIYPECTSPEQRKSDE